MKDVDQLESRQPRGFRARPVSMRVMATFGAAAVTATLVGVSWAWHPRQHRSNRPPPSAADNSLDRPATARPSPTASRTPADQGTVFVQYLGECTRTDHRHTLRVAVAVQNFADGPLRLVSVDMIDRIPGLTLRGQAVGARPCAEQPRSGGRLLRPGQEMVVALDFAVGPTCPPSSALATRLGFAVGGNLLHADTANLVDVSSLHFTDCG